MTDASCLTNIEAFKLISAMAADLRIIKAVLVGHGQPSHAHNCEAAVRDIVIKERDELIQINKNLKYGSDLLVEERNELKADLREARLDGDAYREKWQKCRSALENLRGLNLDFHSIRIISEALK